jgi:Flp pilus assembly pilin Flp
MPQHRKTGAAQRRRGAAMIEAALAITLLVLGLLGLSQTVSSSLASADHAAEAALATEAARRMIETIRASDFRTAFARFNGDPGDDPIDGAPALGSGFDVAGLRPLEEDEDGLVGEILFPVMDGAGAASILREDVDLPELGMPRDLNGDGVIDSADHSQDYMLLPVLVRVRWRSASGPAAIELKTILADL